MENLLTEHQNKLANKLYEAFIKKLEELGFVFENEYQLREFCQQRIYVIKSGGKNSYYLDYKDEINTGILLFYYFDKLDISYGNSFNDNTITITQTFFELHSIPH